MEAKPLEIMFALGPCLSCGLRLVWFQAGLMGHRFAHLPGWKSSRYSLSHRHIGFLEEDKTEKVELYPNLLFRITDVLMSTRKYWPLK